MRELGKTSIVVILALSLAYSFVLVSFSFTAVSQLREEFTGNAQSIINLCINSAPSANTTACQPTAAQGTAYSCQLTGIDEDQSNFTFSSAAYAVSRTFSNSTSAPFSVNSSGYFNFTPSNSDVGNFTMVFYVNDNVGCSNSLGSTFFDITVNNTNDAPFLIENIPDISYREGEAINFFLSTYFTDPDLDSLNYTVTGNSLISVEIDSSSRVTISSSSCGVTELVIFSAIDPYNETASSNPVEIECRSATTTSSSGGSSSDGGGGGGGSIRPCVSEFECYDYHMCNATNQKLQRCVDTEGCKRDEYLTLPCRYDPRINCQENWQCQPWQECQPEGIQYRNCTDSSGCGTTRYMPAMSLECEYLPTCSDKILNCHDGVCEEQIDCGGPCSACQQVEVPYIFPDERGLGIYVISSIILILLMAALLYQYFRKEINAALAKAGWLIKRRRSKQILLKDEDKRKLLSELKRFEKRMGEYDIKDAAEKYESLLRYYLMRAVPALPENFTMEQLAEALLKAKKKLPVSLRKVFGSMFWTKKFVDRRGALLAIEELRNIVVQTSRSEPGDIARPDKEIKVLPEHRPLEAAAIKIANTYIALEFEQLAIAKKKYLELLGLYEKLDMKEQEMMFETIARLYTNISYVNSWLSKVEQ